ncbi:hypothetical protein C791_6898 [Amycolatopsis azurea DSM 43854]|uniref:Uncharacterized protein n=1 Tax=Amycolatopsis azurea DSM 43854 TaxID=1238180 RepID=M2QAD2_9PSEU|nr:hypothetical protein C791_6898 [Amycolatopsis azurea DSM 43854]
MTVVRSCPSHEARTHARRRRAYHGQVFGLVGDALAPTGRRFPGAIPSALPCLAR